MLILPAAIGGLIALHLYLVIRLGVTSPPWSKEAAGTGPPAAGALDERVGPRASRRTAAKEAAHG